MSVWITGDCHGDFHRFTLEGFPQQKGMGRDDYMIICGDHGGVWAGERADGYKLDWLENRPFTTLFVARGPGTRNPPPRPPPDAWADI